MRRRKITHPRVSHERWLVSYADFITLLFAFFTTLYAISTVDVAKLSKMVTSMQTAFDTKGGRPSLTSTPPIPDASPAAPALEQVQTQLAERLKQQIDVGRVRLEQDPRGLVVTVREAGAFDIGSSELSEIAQGILRDVAKPLGEIPNPIRVEGHTDDVPISTSRYRSNWELSTARATAVVQFLLDTTGIDPHRLSAAGYGEYHPRVANDSTVARSLNRRVDIVILNQATSRAEEPREF